ncbi:hypothetical protein CXF85_19895 [Colwellia sp. 75C3]|uniref:chalcone isomerase family protein n=1 Tax=Colwellia sp. 75C3 TaxID=888425 RepID=UPI000C323A6B|nr:chalcone isomerase family protein [Colwellia sp. 75C3]PKG81027.1 hypothetical protein CXF85_19895 [Colwellia sp. 75C3]
MFRIPYYLFSAHFSCFCLITICLSQNAAFAKSMTDAMTLPNNFKSTLDTRKFVSIGETTFSFLFWDLYKSQLLTTSGKYPIEIEKDNLLLDINYLADISSDDLIERTIEQWQHLGITPEKYQDYLPELKAIWPNITDGDSLTLLIHQGRSVFYFNQQYVGVINDAKFGQMFLAIWLSENTSEPSLRHELLGGIKDE